MQIKEKYGKIFTGLGKFPGEWYHINLDLAVSRKRVPCRPVPIHQQEEFKWQLTEMQQAGVIIPVHRAMPQISSHIFIERKDQTYAKKCIFA